MGIMNNYYIFEVLEEHEDKLIMYEGKNSDFKKGERFVGYELKLDKSFAVKVNLSELVLIPMSKVKKVYKIEFNKVEGE